MAHDGIRPLIRWVANALVALAVALPVCEAQEDSGPGDPVIVALVNGDPIWSFELRNEVSYRIQSFGVQEEMVSAAERAQFTTQVLDELILTKLRLQKCDELGIEASEEEIDAEIEDDMAKRSIASLSEFYELWKTSRGENREQARKYFRNIRRIQRLYFTKVFTSSFITPEELRAYYVEHESDFRTPTKYRYQRIYLPRTHPELQAIIEALRKDLDDGVDFDRLVERYSQGPRKASGGWYEQTEEDLDQYQDRISREIRSLSPGQVSGIVHTEAGPMVFRLGNKEEGKAIRFDEAQEQIRRKITYERRVIQERRYNEQLFEAASIKKLLR